MKASGLFFFISAVLAQLNNDSYECGEVTTTGHFKSDTFVRGDKGVICLVFDFMEPVMKVVFNPRVDHFDVLQIKGLYTKFDGYGSTAGIPENVTNPTCEETDARGVIRINKDARCSGAG